MVPHLSGSTGRPGRCTCRGLQAIPPILSGVLALAMVVGCASAPIPAAAPATAGTYIAQGQTLYEQSDYTAARNAYERAIELDPQRPEAYNGRGTARMPLGDLDGAIADFTRAIELNPQYKEAYFNRAMVRSHLGDLAGGIADYDLAIALDPQYAQAIANRGLVRRELGDREGALGDFRSCLARQPADDLRNTVEQVMEAMELGR